MEGRAFSPLPCYNWGMDLAEFHALLSPKGQAALQEAMALQPREEDFLRLLTRLSKRCPAGTARAALETAVLRGQAQHKFPQAARMYFTRPALEQASAYQVSAYRAQRFRGFSRLADLGCSIGGDTQALAGMAPTAGIDLDPLRLAMAQANMAALGLGERADFVLADLTTPLPLEPTSQMGLFFDPARRTGERRVFSVRDYQPPLAVVRDWLPRRPAVGVKISPGVKLVELAAYDAEVEFISLDGELKEAALWFGPLKTASRRATVLPGAHSLESKIPATEMLEQRGALLPLDEPRAYLYEPDPAVLRAGLVEALGQELEAAQLDPDIAYLTASRLTPTPFARAWAVEAWLPFSLKRLRAALRERGVGRVVVKKRGSPLQPESLIRDLRLSGDQERVVFLTHLRGRPIAILALNL